MAVWWAALDNDEGRIDLHIFGLPWRDLVWHRDCLHWEMKTVKIYRKKWSLSYAYLTIKWLTMKHYIFRNKKNVMKYYQLLLQKISCFLEVKKRSEKQQKKCSLNRIPLKECSMFTSFSSAFGLQQLLTENPGSFSDTCINLIHLFVQH